MPLFPATCLLAQSARAEPCAEVHALLPTPTATRHQATLSKSLLLPGSQMILVFGRRFAVQYFCFHFYRLLFCFYYSSVLVSLLLQEGRDDVCILTH